MIRNPRKLLALASVGIGLACLAFLPGCRNPVQIPVVPETRAGVGTLLLSVNGLGQARTILPIWPDPEYLTFRLDFAAETPGNGNFSVNGWDGSGEIALYAGVWSLVVTAFHEGTQVAQNSPAASIIVPDGGNVPVDITLLPIPGGYYGRFDWDLGFNPPEFRDRIRSVRMIITHVGGPDDPVSETPVVVGGVPMDFTIIADGDYVGDTYGVTLPAGEYRAVFTLYNVHGERADLSRILHVYQNLDSRYEFVFTPSHFPQTLLDFFLGAWQPNIHLGPGQGSWDFTPDHFWAFYLLDDILGLDDGDGGYADDGLQIWLDDLANRYDVPGQPIDGEGPAERHERAMAELRALVDAALVGLGADDAFRAWHTYRVAAEAAIRGFALNTEPGDVGIDWGADNRTAIVTIGGYEVRIVFDHSVPLVATVSVSRDGGPVQRFANLADALASVTDTGHHTITLYENQQIVTWPLLPNQNITLQGWNNGSVVITHIGAADVSMFNIQNASLTLGNNITLRGRPDGTAPSIVVGNSGTLTMLDGSEISGHATVGNISPILISGTGARLDIQGGEITGNNNVGGRLIAAVDLNNGVLTMSGGSITGNNTNASGEWADAAMSANNAVTATLSGTAEIGIIRLSPSDAPAPGGTTRVAIGAGWTGNIGRLDLAHDAATPALVAAYWDGRIVLSGSDGRTLTAGDVAQVALGYFVTTAMLPVTQRIIGHAIASSGADLGRLLLTGTAANPIQPPGATPADQLDWLRANAASGNYYLIELTGNAAIAPQTTLVPAGTNGVTITLLGAGHTVNLDGNGTLFTVVDGATLALGNITLEGHDDNNASLVRVMPGGTLYMNEGSAITGNNNTTGFGGGVLNGGTFTMHNGRISGNIAGSSGGGVWIQPSATFTMHNGEIYDNHARGVGDAIGNGGGVAVGEGTFAMYGGTITGNTAIRGGGGVVVGGVGTFAMSGGTISGNEANLNGGGVYVGGNATFQIINGTIYGTGLSANRATGTGTALHMNPGAGTAQRGTFDAAGAFVSMDNLLIGTNFRNDTISITNGVPQQ